MQKSQLITYINHLGRMDRDSLEKMRKIKELYPYFTTVRLLLVRNLYQLSEAEYNSEIEVAAAHVTDRRILYELIHPLSETAEMVADEGGKTGGNRETSPEQQVRPDYEVVEPAAEPLPEPDIAETSQPAMAETSEPIIAKTSEPPAAEKSEPAKTEKSHPKPREKSDLRKNIANLLSWQLHELELVDPAEAELVPEIAIDIGKTYGGEENLQTPAGTPDDLLVLDLEPDQSAPPVQPESSPGETKNDAVSGDLQSFSDWLSVVHKPGQREEPPAEKKKKSPAHDIILIDKFIETNPRLEPRKENVPHVDISEDSVKEHDGIFTDTLARIYIKQGYYSKAIFAYEKLILKYPEKSGYFASQIEAIKKLTNKQ